MSGICVKCGNQIENLAASGRPKSYCNEGCRRAAEFEIRRLNNLIAELEAILSKKRLGWGSSGKDDIEKTEAEIARQEIRLSTLLSAPEK